MKKDKIVSLFLAGLIVFTTNSFKVKSGDIKVEHSIEREDDEGYTVLPIKSLFNMTEEESKKEVILGENIYLDPFDIKSQRVILLSEKKIFSYIRKGEESKADNIELIESGKAISYEKLLEINPILPNNFSQEFISVNYELSSGEIMYYEYTDDNGISRKIINKNFFEQVEYIDTPTLGNWMSIETFIKLNYKLTLDNNPYFTREEYHNKTMTLDKLFEIYKKIVPINSWPVIQEKEINLNTTLPKLKEEILDVNVDDLYLYRLENEDASIVKYFIFRIFNEDDNFVERDLFSNEEISKNSKFNQQYFKNIGFVNIKKLDEIYSLTLTKNTLFAYYTEYIPEVNSIALKLSNANTVEEFIDAYQHLPLENQVDYSYFDFKKSPNVIHPGSNIIVNKESNFIADLNNMTLSQLEKPKIKELNKKS